jgi:GT2 family glycosyltransferase/glycosyltransferase involved in cell wall biosynthesis
VTRGESIAAIRHLLAANPGLAESSVAIPRVDIVVPLYNAPDQALACLESVARHTSTSARLIVINDGSPDPAVGEILTGIRDASPRLLTIDRAQNVGFVRTVNEGMRQSTTNDVVLLNSDTRVTAHWLRKLVRAADSRPRVATVTPLTNNGTICSVPDTARGGPLPEGYDADQMAALVDATSMSLYPQAPTGVGFCMLIMRAALSELGMFDADAFARGYGEENDFCQRAVRAGFVNLIADDAFVYHEGGSSFGGDAARLLDRNLRTLVRRYPSYIRDVRRFSQAHPLRSYSEYLRKSIEAGRTGAEQVNVRVLHVLHDRGGGTERHVRDLATRDDGDVLSFVLTSDSRQLHVDEHFRGRILRSMRFDLPAPVVGRDIQRSDGYADVFGTICTALRINLIHVHHLLQQAIDLQDVADAKGIPYVVTLHDYYMLCPSYTLLDPEGRLCTDCQTATIGRSAALCMQRIGRPAEYLLTFQDLTHRFLMGARRIFVPNVTVKERIQGRFPDLAESMAVIEHGSRIGPQTPASHPADHGGQLHVAALGGLDVHKGLSVLRNLLRQNRRDDIVFHLYGTTTDPDIMRLPRSRVVRLDGSRFCFHGPYEATGIVARLQADRIHVGMQLSIWPETFSYTLSEFVEAGIPVIAGDLGAQGERVRRCRLGWTVPDVQRAGDVLTILHQLVTEPGLLQEAHARMGAGRALTPIADMWRRYGTAYRSVAGDTIARGDTSAEAAPETLRARAQALDRAMQTAAASGSDGLAAVLAGRWQRGVKVVREQGTSRVVRLSWAMLVGMVATRLGRAKRNDGPYAD